jgi:hypothetical protein
MWGHCTTSQEVAAFLLAQQAANNARLQGASITSPFSTEKCRRVENVNGIAES